jgi:glycosyltransferase involved in cell wall biosynthesis
MKKIMLVSDSAPIHPRLKKIGGLFRNHDIKYLMWDRKNFYSKNKIETDDFVYESEIGYGNKIKILKELPLFIHYIKKSIKDYKPDVIVARYFLIAFIVVILTPKNIEVYYDVCDMPLYNNKVLNKILLFLEKIILKRVVIIILGSRFFCDFYIDYKNKVRVIENKVDTSSFDLNISYNINDLYGKLVINYIGKVRYFDILKNVLSACKDLDVILNFYGDGSDLENCIRFVKENEIKNVNFEGRFDYKDVKKYYCEADCILSTYPSEDINVQFAIPNKFYEALYFDKPIIVSKGTKLGELVDRNSLGIVLNSNTINNIRDEILKIIEDRRVLENISYNIQEFKKHESVLWDEKFNLFD